MTTSTETRLGNVIQWILAKNPARSSIDPSEDLIVNRLIDSLSFVEFVFLIEQESGASIDVENIDLEQFRTLNAIERAFFG
ncbi:MAG TPA: acyl carrier protein [Pseudonocardiaceae bacterium]|jgi:acyl carrier protein